MNASMEKKKILRWAGVVLMDLKLFGGQGRWRLGSCFGSRFINIQGDILCLEAAFFFTNASFQPGIDLRGKGQRASLRPGSEDLSPYRPWRFERVSRAWRNHSLSVSNKMVSSTFSDSSLAFSNRFCPKWT